MERLWREKGEGGTWMIDRENRRDLGEDGKSFVF